MQVRLITEQRPPRQREAEAAPAGWNTLLDGTSNTNLVAVSCFGEAKPQAVCHALQLDKSTLSRDGERMRAQGWLVTRPGEDGRTSLLRLTSNGRQVLRNAIPAWQQAQHQATALLARERLRR
ncbi:MAG: winged helix-turn-helix transcriptional regulator [Acidobacteria bacterium]|nr:winged helix-turn-helix transcriptional regulator [Acidobacteriota bacterium]